MAASAHRQVAFDRFHVMKLAQQVVDEVRKQLQREGHDVKGSLWALRGQAHHLSVEHHALREK